MFVFGLTIAVFMITFLMFETRKLKTVRARIYTAITYLYEEAQLVYFVFECQKQITRL